MYKIELQLLKHSTVSTFSAAFSFLDKKRRQVLLDQVIIRFLSQQQHKRLGVCVCVGPKKKEKDRDTRQRNTFQEI
jgi:hypothetical protein